MTWELKDQLLCICMITLDELQEWRGTWAAWWAGPAHLLLILFSFSLFSVLIISCSKLLKFSLIITVMLYKSPARFAPCPHCPRARRLRAQRAARLCSGMDPALGRAAPARAARPRRPPASCAPARTCASRRGRAPSASPCPCRGPCRRQVPHRRPSCHSETSSSALASCSASTSLH